MSAVIGIFDSGLGGLSVLREVRRAIPDSPIIYYADSANCPYGPREADFLVDRARDITSFLIGKGARIVVVACNTATSAAIATLRAEFPSVSFVGLEPAVKPAALVTESCVIGVLATKGTLNSRKYLLTKKRFCDKVRVVERVGEGFVELVENLELEGPRAENVVRASLQPILDAGADTIALGCTHYPFLLPLMRRIAPEVTFIDPAPAVAKQVAKQASGLDTIPSGSVELFSSGDPAALYRLYDTLRDPQD